MENSTPIPPDGSAPPESLRRGFETTDASLRAVLIFMGCLIVGAIVIHLGVWALMRANEHSNARLDAAPSPFAARRDPPPEPRLQPSPSHPTLPFEDLQLLRNRWHAELSGYALVSGQPERARIPIDRAMEIIVERGVAPAATQPTSQPGGGR